MSVTLTTLRSALLGHLLYANNAYSVTKLDYAWKWALEDFARRAEPFHLVGTVAIADEDVTVTHGLSRFLPGKQLGVCYIASPGYQRVVTTSRNDIQNHYNRSASSGRPQMVSFIGTTQMMVYPQADGAYTLNVPYVATAPSWTYGTETPDSVTLDIPETYALGGLVMGAKWHLVAGNKDARAEAAEARGRYEEFVENSIGEVHDLGVSLSPGDELVDQSYLDLGDY